LSERPFIKLYWDIDAGLAARFVLGYVEYVCEGVGPSVILDSEFMAVLRLGRTATRSAIREAICKGLVVRGKPPRGNGRGGFVYSLGDGSIPPTSVETGHVYVIEFSDGTVKVGKSARPKARVNQHASTAACFGITIIRQWISNEHVGCDSTERRMIESLRAEFASRNGGEFFVDGFDTALDVATQLIGCQS
jgi:hypothetical protein